MTGHPASQDLLAQALRACARGIYPDEAAIELIIAHGTFLHRDDFTRHIITSEYGHRGSMTVHAAIDWAAALSAGALPCSSGEKRILHLAASLATGLPADLRDTMTGLDHRNLALAIDALMHASGQRPPHLGP